MPRRKGSRKGEKISRPKPVPKPSDKSLYLEFERIMSEEPEFRDESLAPEIDEDLLRALVHRKLPEKSARLVYLLIYSFKSWYDAHTRILVEEFRRTGS